LNGKIVLAKDKCDFTHLFYIRINNIQNYDWKPEAKIPLKTGVGARIILKMYLRKIGCRLVSLGVESSGM
jgi:hypothetical protein